MIFSNIEELKKTKIVATYGPASRDKVKDMILAGVNVFRLNFSHGTHEQHAASIKEIRSIAAELDVNIGLLADLQGPKIRVGKIKDPGIYLEAGDKLIITTEEMIGEGNKVPTSYLPMPDAVNEGSRILLDDGLIELSVDKIENQEVHTTVVIAGLLLSNKGINLPNSNIKGEALTEKDLKDLDFIITKDFDFVALSFVRSAEDIDLINKILYKNGSDLSVIAKIERPEALDDIDAIIEQSYGIMVARGDLGVEISPENVPTVQKDIVRKCNLAGKPVIVATQMLDSMIRNPRPTRAESSDVANAVLDGASAVMLSGESASGQYPLESVEIMNRIILNTEKRFFTKSWLERSNIEFSISTDVEGITYSVVKLSDMLNARLIFCLTRTGRTARDLARYRPGPPVIVIGDKHNPNVNTLSLSWGVYVLTVDDFDDTESCLKEIENRIHEFEYLEDGDLVVISGGLPLLKKTSGSNMLKLHRMDRKKKLVLV